MHVTQITVQSIRHSYDGKRVFGDVAFAIETETTDPLGKELLVSCNLPFSQKIRADALLVGDAIRQLRKLPAIRSGREVISFDKGLVQNPMGRGDMLDSRVMTG